MFLDGVALPLRVDGIGEQEDAHRCRKGLWYCPRDIPPQRIKRVLTFQELAATPAA